MGYRTLTHNNLGHTSHHFTAHDRTRQRPEDKRTILSCWCGEIVEEVSK